MIDDGVITGKVLLQHMQGMKGDLQTQIERLEKKVDKTIERMDQGFERMDRGFEVMREGFEDARLHREALQEDLYATMRVQAKHGRKLARLTRT